LPRDCTFRPPVAQQVVATAGIFFPCDPLQGNDTAAALARRI
jgi:hypothetical protein